MTTLRRCLLALAPLLAMACDQPRHLIINDGTRDAVAGGVDFGAQAITTSAERTLVVTNRSGVHATIEAVVLGPMATPSFTIVEDACAQQQLAPKTGQCAIRVAFAPQSEGTAATTLTLRYRVEGDNFGLDVALRGSGVLDCSLAPELQQARTQGASEATAKNTAEAARGDAAGRALTHDDGYNGGYQSAYDQSYQSGYHDPTYGYDAGYDYGYSDGLADGHADPAACVDGQNDGGSVGASDGASHGLSEGYDTGYSTGYNTGYADGQDGCVHGTTSLAIPKQTKDAGDTGAPLDEKWISACRAQGYAATIDNNAYAAAYNTARTNNVAYQTGYNEGSAAGTSAGTAAGRAKGYADGDDAGYKAGYAAGANESYTVCYNNAYGAAYQSAYDAAYQSSSGYPGGYDAGYNDGYNAGYAYLCPT